MTSIVARNAYRPGVADPRVVALLARKLLRVATVAMPASLDARLDVEGARVTSYGFTSTIGDKVKPWAGVD